MSGMMGMSPGHPGGAGGGQMVSGFHPGATPPGRSPMHPGAMMGMPPGGSPHHHPHMHHGHGHHIGTPPHHPGMAAAVAAGGMPGLSPGHGGPGMMISGGGGIMGPGGPMSHPSLAGNAPGASSAGLMQQQQPPQQQQQQQSQDKDTAQVSSLPLPPSHYVDLYTDQNVSAGLAPRPPPPLSDTYSMFGAPFNASDDATIVQSLESQGIRRLYHSSAKDVDRKRELQKLNQSALVNFLDLLDILIRAPESPKREEKLEDLNLIFIHMHHLINEFRPHQARETLRVMLHVQKRKRTQVAERFQQHLEKVQETIEDALNSLPEQSESEDKMLIPGLRSLRGGASSPAEESASSTPTPAVSNGDSSADLASSCSGQDQLFCLLADQASSTSVAASSSVSAMEEDEEDGGGGGIER